MTNIILTALLPIILFFNSNFHTEDAIVLLLEHELQTLNLKNPKQDLTTRIKEKDFRFIGLYGFTMYFPGVSKDDFKLTHKYGILPIKGTSDYIKSQRHSELIKQAQRYAKKYNTALLAYIKAHSPAAPSIDHNCWKWEVTIPKETQKTK